MTSNLWSQWQISICIQSISNQCFILTRIYCTPNMYRQQQTGFKEKLIKKKLMTVKEGTRQHLWEECREIPDKKMGEEYFDTKNVMCHTYVEYTITPPGRANWTAWSNILLWYFACVLKDSIVSCHKQSTLFPTKSSDLHHCYSRW